MQLNRKWMMGWFGPALIVLGVVCSAAAQAPSYSATTETRDSTWNRSTRVKQTRVEANGRTIETEIIEAPSINGGYVLASAMEKEISHDGPGRVRVVERWYVPDADGRRQLSRITESETTTVPGKSKTTIRTRYDNEDGHLQEMERDTEESTPLNASTNQTVSTVSLRLGGVFVPVQKTVTVESKQNGFIDVQRTVSAGDANGQAMVPTLVTDTLEEPAGNGDARIKEERVLRADPGMVPAQGQTSLVERTVVRQWKDRAGHENSVAERQTRFPLGIAEDGELHADRQVATARQDMADGSTQVVEEITAINSGGTADRPGPVEKTIEISRRGAGGQFETQTIVEAPNPSGAMQPFWISNTRGFKTGKE